MYEDPFIKYYISQLVCMFILSLFICLVYKKDNKINILNCVGFTILQFLSFLFCHRYLITSDLNKLIVSSNPLNLSGLFISGIIFCLISILIGLFQARSFEKQFQKNLFIALSQYTIFILGQITTFFLIDLSFLFCSSSFTRSLSYSIISIGTMSLVIQFYYKRAQKIIDTPFMENKTLNTSLIMSLFVLIYVFYFLYQSNHGSFIMYILFLGSIGLCVGTVKLLERITDMTYKEYETKLQNIEFEHQRATYQKVQKSIETLSKMHHDMIYILTHIKNLNNHSQYEEIKKFVTEQINRLEKMQKPIFSGNSTLDYIIFELMPKINERKTHFSCNQFNDNCPVSNVVYYAIVGEMLDIAINHSQTCQTPTIMIQHGITHEKYYTKIKFSTNSNIDGNSLKHIRDILFQYCYEFMEHKDVNMYEIGFIVTKQQT